eukprot:CAMPEP_0206058598 /NCGR_PEP_ID=MMETSP1466-20131121/47021_1 /ASSEMBLY_ACC=CAM_ASM_001126 /TAXON_ID=44452 /ORGANISM="Pavlova gyrans, Strain CCMP608" /LENGTH=373 /DNA_ID=CAMNT_0053433893 /DNA_START=54 /DNA_END=1175 /DNA_ORIENTATION=-
MPARTEIIMSSDEWELIAAHLHADDRLFFALTCRCLANAARAAGKFKTTLAAAASSESRARAALALFPELREYSVCAALHAAAAEAGLAQLQAVRAEAGRLGHTWTHRCLPDTRPVMQWTDDVCVAAAQAGRLDVLEWAHSQGCRLTEGVFIAVARRGDQEMLDWALCTPCNDFPFEVDVRLDVCYEAAERGDLALLKWAHSNHFNWEQEKVLAATAARGHLEMLEWVLSERDVNCGPLTRTGICAIAAIEGHLEMLRALRDRGAPWCKNTCINAAHGGLQPVVEALTEPNNNLSAVCCAPDQQLSGASIRSAGCAARAMSKALPGRGDVQIDPRQGNVHPTAGPAGSDANRIHPGPGRTQSGPQLQINPANP